MMATDSFPFLIPAIVPSKMSLAGFNGFPFKDFKGITVTTGFNGLESSKAATKWSPLNSLPHSKENLATNTSPFRIAILVSKNR